MNKLLVGKIGFSGLKNKDPKKKSTAKRKIL